MICWQFLNRNLVSGENVLSVVCFCQEFDREESKKVQELFDGIDFMLYESSVLGPSHLCCECCEWTSHFPHLR